MYHCTSPWLGFSYSIAFIAANTNQDFAASTNQDFVDIEQGTSQNYNDIFEDSEPEKETHKNAHSISDSEGELSVNDDY